MSRELLVLARDGSAGRGDIISVGPSGNKWGSDELDTDKFVIAEIDDDKTDFVVPYETGKQSLGEPDPETGVPTVIKEIANKYGFMGAKVDEMLAAGGRKTIILGDIIDKEQG